MARPTWSLSAIQLTERAQQSLTGASTIGTLVAGNSNEESRLKALKETGKEVERLLPVILKQVVEANAEIAKEWGCQIDKTVDDISRKIAALTDWKWPWESRSACEKAHLPSGDVTPGPMEYFLYTECERRAQVEMSTRVDRVAQHFGDLGREIRSVQCSLRDVPLFGRALWLQANVDLIYYSWDQAERDGCLTVESCAEKVGVALRDAIEIADKRDTAEAKLRLSEIEKTSPESFVDIDRVVRLAYTGQRSIETARARRVDDLSKAVAAAERHLADAEAVVQKIAKNTKNWPETKYGPTNDTTRWSTERGALINELKSAIDKADTATTTVKQLGLASDVNPLVARRASAQESLQVAIDGSNSFSKTLLDAEMNPVEPSLGAGKEYRRLIPR